MQDEYIPTLNPSRGNTQGNAGDMAVSELNNRYVWITEQIKEIFSFNYSKTLKQKPATFLGVTELFTSFCFCFIPYNKDVLSNMPAVSPQSQTESSARDLLAL